MKPETQKPLVSVIIPSYNSQLYISRCLHSVINQHTTLPYEIIVVDSSKDDTPIIIKHNFPSVQLISLKSQTFPGAARDIGVKISQGEIIAFIDSGCIASQDWLEKGIHTLHQGYSFVGGAVKNANPGIISTTDYILTFSELFPTMPSREVSFMATCNFMCMKEAFKKVGGFDPSLLAGEDTLFCYLAAQNFSLYFNNSLLISHHNRVRFTKFMNHQYNFGKYASRLRKKVKLPGNTFAKYPFLALFIPGVRFIRISLRMIRWNYKMVPQFILLTPLILVGIFSWSWGFIRENFQKK